MATVSDVTTTPLSGLNHIDALLDSGPDWNYLSNASNTLRYTFSVASGNEVAQAGETLPYNGSLQAFTAAQQAATRTAFAYLSTVTGIQFVETAAGTDADIHMADVNLPASNVTGLCSWHSSYSYRGTELASYSADAYVYLDNVEWWGQNSNLTPGGQGYETLLHELGHALGLKHSFDANTDNATVLPQAQDNTSNTLMSYTDLGGPYSTYRQDDIAALRWLYGGDGLGGALGMNSQNGARYITGTSGGDSLRGTTANDTLEGDGGNDMIYGGDGTDTAVFRGLRNDYTFANLANGDLQVTNKAGSTAADGVDTLSSIEVLRFADASVARADVGGAAAVPSLAVTKNANGYAAGDTPVVTGAAQAGATIKIFTSANVQVGSATADASGLFSAKLSAFSDGQNYQVYATATDAAGNVSQHSPTAVFNIDAHAPTIPTSALQYTPSSNLATFSGTGEAGTTIQLVQADAFITIAQATVGADGKWAVNTSPLPNADYRVIAVSSDAADNATSSGTTLNFSVNSAANITGTTGNDKLAATAGGNAINGAAGIDTAVYAGTRASYTVAKEVWGYGVTDNAGNGGHDSLINVERAQFSDGFMALDVDGNAGQVFRLYQAAFDRPAEAAGMGYWLWRMDNGTSLDQMSLEFTKQPEFDTFYGKNPSNADFVTHLYANVLDRAPEGAGYDYWMNVLNTNGATRAQVLAFFSESPENQAQVIGSIQDGITYTPWVA